MKIKEECKTCSPKPNKCIFVDDVYNPICPDCGKDLLSNSMKTLKDKKIK